MTGPDLPRSLPQPHDPARAARTADALAQAGGEIAAAAADPEAAALIAAAAGNSPYLARLMLREREALPGLLQTPPGAALDAILDTLDADLAAADGRETAMAALRRAKRRAALLIALADISGRWTWIEVTAALTRLADASAAGAVRVLLREAAAAGRIHLRDPAAPDHDCGLIVLAMGKHGAGELNYSSDIDLTVYFDPDLMPLAEGVEPGPFAIRLTQGLVQLLQEQTADGYVFRVDLRLRPDAGATQVAIAVEAAELYFESFGQNWERAAHIKARPVAGDLAAGAEFLKSLEPFVFRRYLDYAAIEDIHAIKRQIHAHGGHGRIAVQGHDIKLGRGGIREIEFFVQTQQLIMGGRDRALRGARTCEVLHVLAQKGHITPQAEAELASAYAALRHVEHRLQMVEDEQTQTLPKSDEGLAHIACFCGFPDAAVFSAWLRGHLERVQRHYAALFESAPPLAERRGSLVFTGVDDDPETLATLHRLGFSRPADVAATIRGWHHGRVRAMRSARARERLTALTPALLEAFGASAHPDLAFAGFDRFLNGLPSGVQVFALLFSNPTLLGLLADAFGTAPRFAAHLGRNPALLDALLDADFLTRLPGPDEFAASLAAHLAEVADYEAALDRARVWTKEQLLRVGLQVVRERIAPHEAGPAFTGIAEAVMASLLPRVAADLAEAHGRLRGGEAVLVAMGKLGSREMTATSDLDLMLIYDAPDEAHSEGARALPASTYFARLTQRLIAALSALTAEGRLYEVDMRLRPSGNKGPVATRLASFEAYQRDEAWTWERMALTRARVIAGAPRLAGRVTAAIRQALATPRAGADIRRDIAQMRARMAAERPGRDPWDLKNRPGGLIDVEFAAQALVLLNVTALGETSPVGTLAQIRAAAAAGVLPDGDAQALLTAGALLQDLQQVLRIAADADLRLSEAGDGLKRLMARVGGARDVAHLEAALAEHCARVRAILSSIVGPIG